MCSVLENAGQSLDKSRLSIWAPIASNSDKFPCSLLLFYCSAIRAPGQSLFTARTSKKAFLYTQTTFSRQEHAAAICIWVEDCGKKGECDSALSSLEFWVWLMFRARSGLALGPPLLKLQMPFGSSLRTLLVALFPFGMSLPGIFFDAAPVVTAGSFWNRRVTA